MIAGHFGFAAAIKAKEPQIPLWSLMLSTQWLDVVFVPLFLTGIESMEPALPDAGHAAPLIHADYTHSLLGALILSAVFGWFAARLWGRRAGIILGAVSMSHWVIDLIVHRPDLPILPGNLGDLPLLGFGLWTFPFGAIILEGAIVVVGFGLYWRAAVAASSSAARSLNYAHAIGALALIAGLVTLIVDKMFPA